MVEVVRVVMRDSIEDIVLAITAEKLEMAWSGCSDRHDAVPDETDFHTPDALNMLPGILPMMVCVPWRCMLLRALTLSLGLAV